MLSTHDLCDDRETCGFFCLEEKIKTVLMKPLECVRGCSRLESTAAEKSSAGAFHILSDLCDLFLRLDRTRSGDHLEIAAADLSAADIDHGVIRVHGAVCLFVRLADPADILNDIVGAQPVLMDHTRITDQSDQGSFGSLREMKLEALVYKFGL